MNSLADHKDRDVVQFEDHYSERSSIVPTGAQSPNFAKSSPSSSAVKEQDTNTNRLHHTTNDEIPVEYFTRKQKRKDYLSSSSGSPAIEIPKVSRRKIPARLKTAEENQELKNVSQSAKYEHEFIVSSISSNLNTKQNGKLQGEIFLPKHAKIKLQKKSEALKTE